MQDEEDAMGAIVGASTDASAIPIAWHSVPMPGWAPPTKPLTLQTVPVRTEQGKGDDLVSQQAGFSLHAGIACRPHQRKKLKRLTTGFMNSAGSGFRYLTASSATMLHAIANPASGLIKTSLIGNIVLTVIMMMFSFLLLFFS